MSKCIVRRPMVRQERCPDLLWGRTRLGGGSNMEYKEDNNTEPGHQGVVLGVRRRCGGVTHVGLAPMVWKHMDPMGQVDCVTGGRCGHNARGHRDRGEDHNADPN